MWVGLMGDVAERDAESLRCPLQRDVEAVGKDEASCDERAARGGDGGGGGRRASECGVLSRSSWRGAGRTSEAVAPRCSRAGQVRSGACLGNPRRARRQGPGRRLPSFRFLERDV